MFSSMGKKTFTTKQMSNNTSTIHFLRVNEIPEHPLTRLQFVDPPTNLSNGAENGRVEVRLSSTNELIGTIPKSADIMNVRFQDLDCSRKKHKTKHERDDERTLRLLSSLSPSMLSRENYHNTPFPHGTHSIEELSLIGADKFEVVMQCFNHWYKGLTPKERILREAKGIDWSTMSVSELKEFEQAMLTLWKTAHASLLTRTAGAYPPC